MWAESPQTREDFPQRHFLTTHNGVKMDDMEVLFSLPGFSLRSVHNREETFVLKCPSKREHFIDLLVGR